MNTDYSRFNPENLTDPTVYPPPTVMAAETDFKKRHLPADELLSSSVVHDSVSRTTSQNQLLTNKHIYVVCILNYRYLFLALNLVSSLPIESRKNAKNSLKSVYVAVIRDTPRH